ncbi:MAG: DUF5060 domain-containing protein [Pseudomonadota bacterium]
MKAKLCLAAIGALSLAPLAACVAPTQSVAADTVEHRVWQPVTLDFVGPDLGETSAANPFTDFNLTVTFRNGSHSVEVPGFFAADGKAAETGADSGSVWRVRFAPDRPGEWSYVAELHSGPGAALSERGAPSMQLHSSWRGSFEVTQASANAPEFYRHGILRRDGRYFRFSGSGDHWLKGGANSPENLLGYADFDGTYRLSDNVRDGEADAGGQLHAFAPHVADWRPGDPTWHGEKGKGLIGAVNYLADQGMNVAYFLVYNTEGDGKDVWPWRDPADRTRFDVSKLAQWEIVFAHMQRRGIALHIVLQETENELVLDGGDTGPQRKLFLREMIARFGHHPALFWNIGEENGPVHWLPEGQSDAQRAAMARYIERLDPYGHPILLHTHSEAADKDTIIAPQLGNRDIAGLSFQVSQRKTVNAEVRKWHELSRKAGHIWPIAMDEIGPWQVGARADRDDPGHDSLRRHALWGALLAGGAGVEWYFGAEQDGNDLTTEDWRSREELWKQTRIALDFFEQNLRYWKMEPCPGEAYCLTSDGDTYAIYLSADTPSPSPVTIAPGRYRQRLFDPKTGAFDTSESEIEITDGALPDPLAGPYSGPDRVALLKAVR